MSEFVQKRNRYKRKGKWGRRHISLDCMFFKDNRQSTSINPDHLPETREGRNENSQTESLVVMLQAKSGIYSSRRHSKRQGKGKSVFWNRQAMKEQSTRSLPNLNAKHVSLAKKKRHKQTEEHACHWNMQKVEKPICWMRSHLCANARA